MTNFQWVTLAMSVLNLIVIPIVGWLLKQTLARYTDQISRLEVRMESAEKDLRSKVSDEEWIRESMKLRNDVSDMSRTLARIEGKTDSTLLVATGINRLANAIENTQGNGAGNGQG